MPSKPRPAAIVPIDHVQRRILLLRGQRVIIDADLAFLYGVTTKRLNEQVQRNADRFPEDFMFQLTAEEAEILRSQAATIRLPSDTGDSRSQIATLITSLPLRSQFATSKTGRGGRRYAPYAFTEHGAIMAATILNSPQAVKASLFVVRAFVQLRQLLSSHLQLAGKLDELERKLQNHDEQILALFDAIRELMEEPEDPPKSPIGFHTELAEPKRRARALIRR